MLYPLSYGDGESDFTLLLVRPSARGGSASVSRPKTGLKPRNQERSLQNVRLGAACSIH